MANRANAPGASTAPPAMPMVDDLRQRILMFLHSRRVPNISTMDIDMDGSRVILSGKMPSLQAKQLCIECCSHVAGVTAVTDELEIDADAPF